MFVRDSELWTSSTSLLFISFLRNAAVGAWCRLLASV